MNLNQVTLPVKDMKKATLFYRRMGFLQIVDTEHYARFESIDGDATFSLHLDCKNFHNGAVIYFEHEKLDDLFAALTKNQFVFEQPPTDKRYLWREAILYDPSGNKIILYWAGEMRKDPPWRVEISG